VGKEKEEFVLFSQTIDEELKKGGGYEKEGYEKEKIFVFIFDGRVDHRPDIFFCRR
jgi:hypothetical protein